MKSGLKVFHAQGWTSYSSWIDNVQIVKTIEEADLVLFEGGEDISPEVYGQKAHKLTTPSKSRDAVEVLMYDKAVELKKPILGICRGAQLIAAKQPLGMLVQHQPNPYSTHSIKTFDGRELTISSSHHQAMFPFNMPKNDYKIIGWTEGMLKFHEGAGAVEMAPPVECEIVFFPKANALGIQGHPEWMNKEGETCIWLRELLDKFLTKQL